MDGGDKGAENKTGSKAGEMTSEAVGRDDRYREISGSRTKWVAQLGGVAQTSRDWR